MHPDAGAKRQAFFAGIGRHPLLMGIINVTPDSFSDGGRFAAPDAAIAQARAHVAAGAAIVDVGAESTRPGYRPVSEAEESARLEPVLTALIAAIPVAVSIDTTKAAVARAALQAGAALVNDQWGLQRDLAMAAVVAEAGAGLVIMHNRDGIDAAIDIMDDMRRFFDRSLALAERAGIARAALILDPGIGFGKSKAQNLQALHGIAALRADYGLPILVGVSRKSLFAALIGARDVGDRLIGTLAANVAAAARGAAIFRVHDCAENRDALAVFDAIARASPDPAESVGWVATGFGLGGNLGDAPAAITRALARLAERGHVKITRVSDIYRTPPWGPVAQADFANACALGATDLEPHALLREVKAVEAELGRGPGLRYGPRVIDIDILFHGATRLAAPDLVIPHPRLFERAFVLVPLAEIAPDLTIDGVAVAAAEAVIEKSGIRRWSDAP